MYTCWDCVEVFCHIYLFSCTNTQLRRDIFNLFLKVTLNAATTCLPYFHYRHTWFPCPLFITATLGYLVTLFTSHTWLPCPSFHYCYTWLLYHPFHHCHTWLPCPFSSQPYLVTLSPFSSLPHLAAMSLFIIAILGYFVTLFIIAILDCLVPLFITAILGYPLTSQPQPASLSLAKRHTHKNYSYLVSFKGISVTKCDRGERTVVHSYSMKYI